MKAIFAALAIATVTSGAYAQPPKADIPPMSFMYIGKVMNGEHRTSVLPLLFTNEKDCQATVDGVTKIASARLDGEPLTAACEQVMINTQKLKDFAEKE
jgi:hypothetical protein